MRKNFSVVIVDDDADIHLLLTRTIQRINPLHKITSLYNGQALIEHLTVEAAPGNRLKELTDLIILDLTMPEMDGYEILKKIRSIPHLENLKIFVLTSGIYEYDRIKSIVYGCTNFYHKPLEAAELIAIVEDMFRKTDTPSLDTSVLIEE